MQLRNGAWPNHDGGTAYRLLAIVLRPAHGDHHAADHKGNDGQHERRDEAKGVGDDVGGHAGQDGHEAVTPGRPRKGLREQVRVKAWPRRRRNPECCVCVFGGRTVPRLVSKGAVRCWTPRSGVPFLPCSQTSHASKTEKSSDVAMPARTRPNISTQKSGDSLVRQEME